ncbi:MAG: hypothetical protein ACI81L_003084 [Verrucomicrobiales bacterium]|jgi:hypothetical protein
MANVVRHLVLSAIPVGLGLGVLVFVCLRYNIGGRSIRRYSIAAAAIMVLIAALSEAAVVRVRPCPGNAIETCEYNDLVPAMATLAVTFALVTIIKTSVLFSER